MKNKKYLVIVIVAAVVLLLVGAFLGIRAWFLSPGYHFLFGYAHVEDAGTGYLFDVDDETFLGMTDFSINCTVGRGNNNNFSGVISLEAYPLEEGQILGGGSISNNAYGSYLSISYCTQDFVVVNSDPEQYDSKIVYSTYHYWVCVPTNGSGTVVVQVSKTNDDSSNQVYAVLAESQEQALQRLHAYYRYIGRPSPTG